MQQNGSGLAQWDVSSTAMQRFLFFWLKSADGRTGLIMQIFFTNFGTAQVWLYHYADVDAGSVGWWIGSNPSGSLLRKWLRKCNLSNLKLLILWGRVHIYAFNPSKAVGKGELFWFFTQPWCEMLEGRTAPLLGVEGPMVGRCGQQHAGWDPFAGTAPFHWNELTAFSSFSC